MTEKPAIETFAIGTELTMGRIQDTNSHWIARQIAQLGGSLRRATILRDSLEEIVEALGDSIRRGTAIIITIGGLGPTPDDLTVEALARIVGRETAPHEPTLQDYMVRRNLSSRDQLTPNLIKMATVPEGAEVFPNPVGWAPCISLQKDGSRIFTLPGPPREMEATFTRHIAPVIASKYRRGMATLLVKVGMHESEVSPLMQEVMDRYPQTYLKAYVGMRYSPEQGLPVDIIATGESRDEAQSTLREASELFIGLVIQRGRSVEKIEES
ncbi:MAG: competence/damage-inducible protein A [bacterium]